MGNPVVLSRSSSRIDIVAGNLSGFLVYCYWLPELDWKGEIPTLDAVSLPPIYQDVEMSPALIVCPKPRALRAVTNATTEARSCFGIQATPLTEQGDR